MKIHRILLFVVILISSVTISCASPQAAKFKDDITKIADTIPLPTYYDKYTGEIPSHVEVVTPSIYYDTQTGIPTARVYGHLAWGFWHSGGQPTVWLAYDGTYDLHPDMLSHPDNFYWVVAR